MTTKIDLLDRSAAMDHMKSGGQVFRITPRDRFFYKIDGGVLMCRCNEIGGWNPSVAALRDSDKFYVAKEDYKTEGFGRDFRVVRIPLPLPHKLICEQALQYATCFYCRHAKKHNRIEDDGDRCDTLCAEAKRVLKCVPVKK